MYLPATSLARWLGVVALVAAFALPAQAQRNVTLRLNTATLPDTTNLDTDIQVRGCLADCMGDQSDLPGGNVIAWNDNTTLRPANDGGDYWSIDFQIPDDQALNFKFFSTQAELAPPAGSGIGGWEDGDNHLIEGGTGDVELTLHYFEKGADQEYDWRPFGAEGDSVAVWFRVYMNTEDAATRGYDPEDEDLLVGMRGGFGTLGAVGANGNEIDDWGTGTVETEVAPIFREVENDGPPGYHLFSGVVKYPASAIGQEQQYKFYFADSDTQGDGGYEGAPNRSFDVPAQDSTLYWVFYGDSPAIDEGNEPVTSEIIFQVNAEPLADAGVLDLTRGDELQIRGGFNGWDCPDDNQDDCGLFQEPGTFNFGNVVPVTAVPQTTLTYKYFAVLQNVDQMENPDFGYEEPLDVGGGDRTFEFAGNEQQDIGLQFFNSVRDGNAIPDQNIDVTFTVDMTAALNYPGEDAFNPAEDTVYVAFEDQIWRLTQGYEPGELEGSIDPDFFLTNTAGNLYTGTFTVDGPTYNGIGYAYAWGSAAEGTTTREGEGGFGPGRRRYRYVLADGAGTFPPAFVFSPDAVVGPDELNAFECNPTDPMYDDRVASDFCEPNGYIEVPTAIEDLGGAQPEEVVLMPNYPNPFRSTTTFEYRLPESGEVLLAVYDLMGRRVATLVDGVQPASTYRVGFEAQDLASGVYIVRLHAAGSVFSSKITVVN